MDLAALHAVSQARARLPLLFLSSDKSPLLALRRQDCVAIRMPLSSVTLAEALIAVSQGRVTRPALSGVVRRQARTVERAGAKAGDSESS